VHASSSCAWTDNKATQEGHQGVRSSSLEFEKLNFKARVAGNFLLPLRAEDQKPRLCTPGPAQMSMTTMSKTSTTITFIDQPLFQPTHPTIHSAHNLRDGPPPPLILPKPTHTFRYVRTT